jgi:hypothetical protein
MVCSVVEATERVLLHCRADWAMWQSIVLVVAALYLCVTEGVPMMYNSSSCRQLHCLHSHAVYFIVVASS